MKTRKQDAFTIVELMVVVSIIGILALLGMPGINMARERTAATVTANNVRVFTEAVEFYSTTKGGYPENMTYTDMPTDIQEYLSRSWSDGTHSWYYRHSSNYTYIYLYNLNFNAEQAVLLDSILDDGNITTGAVRVAYNGSGMVYLFRYPGSI